MRAETETDGQAPAPRSADARLTVLGHSPSEIGASPIVHELRLSGEASPTLALFLAIGEIGHGLVQATIDAAPPGGYGRLDGAGSETLTHGAPATAQPRPAVRQMPRQLRAKDLIAELHSINTQIHRIMFQVERAVAKLATTTQ